MNVKPTSTRSRTPWVLLLAGLGACASAPPVSRTASEPDKAAPPAKKTFENPGGMWMPEQLGGHAEILKSLGLALDPMVLRDPQQAPLAAVVSLGGCSASFVSPQGLVVTNHHCVTGALQFNSTPERNLMKDGFSAATTADEVTAGPTARVYVTQKLSDVTAQMRDGLTDVKDDRARYQLLEDREKEMVAKCEAGRPEIRCRVANYFRGAQYRLIESLELRDVRLVYAPPAGVGVFGGEIDNWMWPRHTGDFSFYRAYVAPDGKPADFAKENVPYRPAHYLKIATDLAEGDLVFVAGYPGRTNRHRTAYEASEAQDWRYPRSIAMMEEYLALLEEISKTAPDVAIKAQLWIRGLANGYKNQQGVLAGLKAKNLVAEKTKIEGDLLAWIDASPERKAQYGGFMDEIKAIDAERVKTREKEAAAGEISRFSSLLGTAVTLVRMAEERPKADAKRDPSFQERNWRQIEQGMDAMDKRYDRRIDQKLFTLAVKRANRLPDVDKPEALAIIMGKKGPYTDADIEAAADKLYRGSQLEQGARRKQLFKKGTPANLKSTNDSMIQLALKLWPIMKTVEERDKRIEGQLTLLLPRYMEALIAFSGGHVAPDANSSLRVTYGTVRGYKPKDGAPLYHPFTYTGEMVAKVTGEEPFDAPAKFVDAAKAKKFGPWGVGRGGEVPLNFLSDVDTTGGNSGSATLNGRGELVGLLFDGNSEALASDWIFLPPVTRGIHCDIRYVLWTLNVDGADNLLRELGVEPSK